MKEKKYTLPEEQNPAFTSEPEPNYHGNAAIALPEEDVAKWEDNYDDLDWDRIPFMGGPTNEKEAIARIKAVEEENERTGISYTEDEFFAKLYSERPWLK